MPANRLLPACGLFPMQFDYLFCKMCVQLSTNRKVVRDGARAAPWMNVSNLKPFHEAVATSDVGTEFVWAIAVVWCCS
jgi:hypothetical protein